MLAIGLQILLVIAALFAVSGCANPRQYWEALKGEGFPEWNENMAATARGDTSKAKPSGFFTDRRSEQIEQHLGGCDPCSGHAAFQGRLKELLRSKCGCDQVPPELVDRLRTLLDPPHAHPS